ncbi:hypothetical protein HanXRQr2_Chr13g0576801 [Helianthus annuus]|uniref:Uncharacterized protein n=1 Tax=Helianthus annuus TaxID=4232 RepID=A0A9K3EHK5_HELAN|nr:hypothetical protein HanXRQr2_Chr13g0576801 [Helianthus annuus]KAJ0848260.1 hypothetical protein HanPSC8_Chr13g0555051 [Helianthus annuus]
MSSTDLLYRSSRSMLIWGRLLRDALLKLGIWQGMLCRQAA